MRRTSTALLVSALGGLLLLATHLWQAPIPITNAAVSAGYTDFSFFYAAQGTSSPDIVQAPTAEKVQSKLWYNDGRWWGSLFNNDPSIHAYHIYWLNQANQQWVDTGTALDSRPQTRADALWDGTHLYIASGGVVTTTAQLDGVLFRYSYNSAAHQYTRDFGPITVRTGGAKAIVIDKDTTGKLWITYVQNNQVWVSHSLNSDSSWGAPFVLPVAGTSVTSEDISSLIAFDGKIGVMWSNVATGGFYFATHVNGDPDTTWTSSIVTSQPGLGNDHINLKTLPSDPSGTIFAAIKTKFTTPAHPATDPQIELLVGKKQADGTLAWSSIPVSDIAETQTRPILLIDTDNRQLYIFSSTTDGGAVWYKSASLDHLQFDPTTKGTLLIRNPSYPFVGNVTSTKQNLNSITGIVALASYDNSLKGYPGSPAPDVSFQNVIALGAPPPTATATPTTTPPTTPTATPAATPTPAGANGGVRIDLPLIRH